MDSALASQAAYCIRQSLIDNNESNGLYVIDQAVKNCPDEDTANLLDKISKSFVQHWYYSYVLYRRVVDDRLWCTHLAACLMMAFLERKTRPLSVVINHAKYLANNVEKDIDVYCILDQAYPG